MTSYRTAIPSAAMTAEMQRSREQGKRVNGLIDAIWKLKTEPSRPADHDADYSCIISEYSRQDFYAAIELMLELADDPLHMEGVKPVGRIVDHQTGWSWFQMDDAGDLKPGDVIRVTPYVESEFRRIGQATIMRRMGHVLHFDQSVCGSISTIAELDYVFRVDR